MIHYLGDVLDKHPVKVALIFIVFIVGLIISAWLGTAHLVGKIHEERHRKPYIIGVITVVEGTSEITTVPVSSRVDKWGRSAGIFKVSVTQLSKTLQVLKRDTLTTNGACVHPDDEVVLSKHSTPLGYETGEHITVSLKHYQQQ